MLQTDSRSPLELLPGLVVRENDRAPLKESPLVHWGPRTFLGGRGQQRNWFNRWTYWTAFPFLCVAAGAYRWSVKATCIFYLPLFYIAKKGEYRPKHLEKALRLYKSDPVNLVRKGLALLTLAGLAVKFWFYFLTEKFAEGWDGSRMKFLKMVVVPEKIPLWHVAGGISAALSLGLWYYAWRIDWNYRNGVEVKEESVLSRWRTLNVVAAVFAVYTIGCGVVIVWKEGRLWDQLQRVLQSIDWRIWPA